MPPSNWHDSNKDAGHDEMVADIHRYYRDRLKRADPYTISRTTYSEKTFYFKYVEIERPFIGGRYPQVLGFCDIALLFETRQIDEKHEYTKTRATYSPDQWWMFLEVKPIIYSVGSVIRQCKATKHLATRCDITHCNVYPVVCRDDPKTELLEELYYCVQKWDRPTS